jgi:hypothetical protein
MTKKELQCELSIAEDKINQLTEQLRDNTACSIASIRGKFDALLRDYNQLKNDYIKTTAKMAKYIR